MRKYFYSYSRKAFAEERQKKASDTLAGAIIGLLAHPRSPSSRKYAKLWRSAEHELRSKLRGSLQVNWAAHGEEHMTLG